MIELLYGVPDWMKIMISLIVPLFELRFSIPFGLLNMICKIQKHYLFNFAWFGI
jgi:hypothetical protein